MQKKDPIFISDVKSLSGQSIYSALCDNGYKNILTTNYGTNLNNFKSTSNFFKKNKPKYVIITSSKSGGIEANLKYPVDLIEDNIISQYNIIKLSHQHGVKKLMFVASSCIYPKAIKKPAKEIDLLTGKIEDSNQSYSIAKISGIEMCRAYRLQYKDDFFSVVPTNIFGPGEIYDKKFMHVIPSLIKKIHNAKINKKKIINLLGNGQPVREFLYSIDFADACIKILNSNKKSDIINIGSGNSMNIKNLANKLKKIIGYKGQICFSSKKLNGTNIKKLNFNKLKKIGWKPKTNIILGLKETYFDYLNQMQYK